MPNLVFKQLSFNQLNFISKDNRYILHQCQGRIDQGDRIVLTGQSGSGKTLLLRMLAGLSPLQNSQNKQHHQTQNIWLNDKSQSAYHPVIWRSHIRLMPQHPVMIEGSVRDNLKLPFQFQAFNLTNGFFTFDEEWHRNQLLKLDRSASFLQKNANHLSGGEKQLVQLLRYLQLNPALLLLDEPTSALDKDSTAMFETVINDWITANPNSAYIWITHDTTQTRRIGKHHWSIHTGKLNTNHTPI